jgi:translation initiation factor IF-2
MSHRHKRNHHRIRISKSREWLKNHRDTLKDSAGSTGPKLEFVLKCDSAGSVEAVTSGVSKIVPPGVDISVIQSGVGNINHSDILMAKTGSSLIAGFQTGVLPGLEKDLDEHAVEVRLYSVIYKLTDDIQKIAESMLPSVSEEEITGTARVIAIFKSSRKGTIIGCEVLDGYLSTGRHFRIISEMGPVYSGTIESMHIEKNTVQKAVPGQQVGIKIEKFNKAKIGDTVESFRPAPYKKNFTWQPKGEVIRIP